jgi:hypothetical protein
MGGAERFHGETAQPHARRRETREEERTVFMHCFSAGVVAAEIMLRTWGICKRGQGSAVAFTAALG